MQKELIRAKKNQVNVSGASQQKVKLLVLSCSQYLLLCFRCEVVFLLHFLLAMFQVSLKGWYILCFSFRHSRCMHDSSGWNCVWRSCFWPREGADLEPEGRELRYNYYNHMKISKNIMNSISCFMNFIQEKG